MLGLWFSVTRGSTRRATLWTLTAAAVLGLAHWLPWLVVRPPKQLQLPHTIAFFGLTPPAALNWVALNGDDLGPDPHGTSRVFIKFTREEFSFRSAMTWTPSWHYVAVRRDEAPDVIWGTIVGLLFWAGLMAALWLLTLRKFQRMRC
jgi:hypothetical protein